MATTGVLDYVEDAVVARLESGYEADLKSLVGEVRSRLGASTHISLHSLASPAGPVAPVTPMLLVLSDCIDEVEVWRPDDRWVGVGIGWLAPGDPLRIVAAAGCASDLPA